MITSHIFAFCSASPQADPNLTLSIESFPNNVGVSTKHAASRFVESAVHAQRPGSSRFRLSDQDSSATRVTATGPLFKNGGNEQITMTLAIRILGEPGRDNAVYVTVDSGQSILRLLFDCGSGCLEQLPVSDIQEIDAALFSHFHMDHISGFDALLRHNFNRTAQPLRLFGPCDAQQVLEHRLRGFTWNLVDDMTGRVEITSIGRNESSRVTRFTKEAFAHAHDRHPAVFDGCVLETDEAVVEAIVLDHGCPCLGYRVTEHERVNVDSESLRQTALPPGPWLAQLKDGSVPDETEIDVANSRYVVGELRRKLLQTTAGSRLAYLTDFRSEGDALSELIEFVEGVDVLVCESNFGNADRELAIRSRHLVSDEVARLAESAGVGRLILFHLSDRYSHDEWFSQLRDVRRIFPNSHYPKEWDALFDGG